MVGLIGTLLPLPHPNPGNLPKTYWQAR
jgi:hypothetical protein